MPMTLIHVDYASFIICGTIPYTIQKLFTIMQKIWPLFQKPESGQKYTTFCPVFPPKMHSGTSFMVSFKNFIAMFWEFNPETNQYRVWKRSARLEKQKSQKPEGFFLLHDEF